MQCKQRRKIFIFLFRRWKKLTRTEFEEGDFFQIQCNGTNEWIKNKAFQSIWLKKEYYSSKWRSSGKNNPFYGKKHSDEFKQKLSEERKGVWNVGSNNPMFGKTVYDIWLNEYGKDEADRRHFESAMKNSSLSSGSNNPMFGKTVYTVWLNKYGEDEANRRRSQLLEKRKNTINTPKYKKIFSENAKKLNKKLYRENPEKYIENRRKAARISMHSQNKFKKNKIETKVEEWLKDHGFNCEYSAIVGKYQYDFIIHGKRVLIEVQGDFWHANPKFYGEKLFKDLHECQKFKIIRDLQKKIYAKERNFKVIPIWEDDINKHNFSILEELL